MRSLASDNNSGVHPLILEAIVSANIDHAIGYGDDKWTQKACSLIKNELGGRGEAMIVFNGTGANSIAIQLATRSFHSVIMSTTAHVYVDECGAPFKLSGCLPISIPTEDGKLTPELIRPHLHGFGFCHHAQPKLIYISQVTELGTVYRPEEIRAIASLAHEYNMYLMMDGARLANACVSLNCTMAELTVDCGVDILSLGGTKNGMMLGEAVVCFRSELIEFLPYFRKQTTQLASKMRYLSAQFTPYFELGIWKDNALNANMKANLLKQKIESLGITPKYAVEANSVFFSLPQTVIESLLKEFFFYVWDETEGIVRLVCSWDTSDDDIDRFVDRLKSLIN